MTAECITTYTVSLCPNGCCMYIEPRDEEGEIIVEIATKTDVMLRTIEMLLARGGSVRVRPARKDRDTIGKCAGNA